MIALPLRLLVALATALSIVGVALLLVVTPLYMHAALGASGSAAILGVTPAEAERVSDATVGELFAGPGTFAVRYYGDRAFYDAAEASHLRDARAVLWAFLGLVVAAVLVLAVGLSRARRQPWFWRAVSRGGAGLAVGAVIIGGFYLVAFDAMFTLFHELFFPGGNWSFDISTERMVQLYPTPFWELTSTVLAGLVVAGGVLAWWLGRRRAGQLQPARREPESPAAAGGAAR